MHDQPCPLQGPIEIARVFLQELFEGKVPSKHENKLRLCFKVSQNIPNIIYYCFLSGPFEKVGRRPEKEPSVYQEGPGGLPEPAGEELSHMHGVPKATSQVELVIVIPTDGDDKRLSIANFAALLPALLIKVPPLPPGSHLLQE